MRWYVISTDIFSVYYLLHAHLWRKSTRIHSVIDNLEIVMNLFLDWCTLMVFGMKFINWLWVAQHWWLKLTGVLNMGPLNLFLQICIIIMRCYMILSTSKSCMTKGRNITVDFILNQIVTSRTNNVAGPLILNPLTCVFAVLQHRVFISWSVSVDYIVRARSRWLSEGIRKRLFKRLTYIDQKSTSFIKWFVTKSTITIRYWWSSLLYD